METRKIGIACFVGGVLGMAAALVASPMFWWLGLLVGFAGGYVSYRFRDVFCVVWELIIFFSQFACYMVIGVYSSERLLCGVDSTLGTLVAYVYFAPGAETLSQYALVCVAGGIIGAFLGIVNYEIFSIRLLKVVPVRIKS